MIGINGQSIFGVLFGSSAIVIANDAPWWMKLAGKIAHAFIGDAVGVCDGTNDQVEIQAAITALAVTGGKIVLSQGTFYIAAGSAAPEITSSNITLAGRGMGVTTIKATSNGERLLFINATATAINNVIISDLTIDGDYTVLGSGGSHYGIQAVIGKGLTNIVIERCEITRLQNAIETDTPIGLAYASIIRIHDNYLHDFWEQAMEITGCVDVNISRNMIFRSGMQPWDGIHTWDAIYVRGGTSIIVADNIISCLGSGSSESGIEVGWSGVAGVGGAPEAPSNVNIINNSINSTLGHAIFTSGLDKNCNIIGNNIYDAVGAGIDIRGYNDRYGADGLNIQGNNIYSIAGIGIKLDYVSVNTILRNVNIMGNSIIATTAEGIYVSNYSDYGRKNPLNISSNVIVNALDGIVIDGNYLLTINNNSISFILHNGIELFHSYFGNVIGNQMYEMSQTQTNTYYGIYVDSNSGKVNISDNTLYNATGVMNKGIYYNTADTNGRIMNNLLQGCTTPISAPAGNQIRGNWGYVTENSGTATGTGAEQLVPHGLSFTPTRQQIALTAGSATANPYHSSDPDATDIKVTAALNQPWYWATVG